MNPVAFQIFGLEIRWYGVVITLGIMVAFIVSYYNLNKDEKKFDTLITGFLVSFPCAIIGARLYYVLFEFAYYKDHLNEIFNIRQGGLAIHGGLIAGILAAYTYCKVKRIDFLYYLDIVAPGIILAQAFGRWGNFFNQEAHGGPVSETFISRFPEFIQNGMYINGVYYHPTFLYESIWNLIVFIILIVMLKRLNLKKGSIICSYAVLYSLGRFFIEGLRTDSLYIGSLRIAQVVSLIGIVGGLIGIIYLNREMIRKH